VRPVTEAGVGAETPPLLVRGGTVVDETGERRADVLVVGGRLAAVGPDLEVPAGARLLEAGGCVVAPGLVDLHAHLRQPGAEEAETIETGARAAALGGYGAVVAMPNTDPPVDSAAVAADVLALGRKAVCRVEVAGAITVGRAGERLAPMGELAAMGVRLFTDDGAGVQDAGVMRRALEYARGLRARGLPVILAQHCETASLTAGGVMHEGAWSSRLGVPGSPAESEELMVARDIGLARLTGGRVHFLHLSTARSLAMVAAAKAEGLAVTAEVTPHHLTLTDEELAGYDPLYKVNPPLRTAADAAAVRQACAAGVVDAVATDHAPHPAEAKSTTLQDAAPGMVGLETALAVTLGALAGDGPAMALGAVLGLLSWGPARIAGLAVDQGGDQGGPLVAGAPANLCVFDPEERWEVDPARLASRSRNTPWAGRTLRGRVRHTVYGGEPVVVDGEAQR
jgi:dihydroorotase